MQTSAQPNVGSEPPPTGLYVRWLDEADALRSLFGPSSHYEASSRPAIELAALPAGYWLHHSDGSSYYPELQDDKLGALTTWWAPGTLSRFNPHVYSVTEKRRGSDGRIWDHAYVAVVDDFGSLVEVPK